MSRRLFRIEPHDGADKEFRIIGPDFDLIVDYDDVDHKFQDKMAKRVVRILNGEWDNYDPVKMKELMDLAPFQPMSIGEEPVSFHDLGSRIDRNIRRKN